jgi:hypothetical protein
VEILTKGTVAVDAVRYFVLSECSPSSKTKSFTWANDIDFDVDLTSDNIAGAELWSLLLNHRLALALPSLQSPHIHDTCSVEYAIFDDSLVNTTL